MNERINIELTKDDHIINFQELDLEENTINQLENTIMICSLCENAQQIKHTRWIKTYLPGIRTATCMFCSNFKFIIHEKPENTFILYHHISGIVFASKLKEKPTIKTSTVNTQLFK